MPNIPALVEPSVLRWARTGVGLSTIATARKLDLADNTVEEWESGAAQPTISQLKQLTGIYKRSLGVFFLPEPPTGFDTLRDFRRLYSVEPRAWSPELFAEYQRALTQRAILLELAELDQRTIPDRWSLGLVETDVELVGQRIRNHLLSRMGSELPHTAASSKYKHLNLWIFALEESGVLVQTTSGGHVDIEEMRAFSLHFETVPVIVLNGKDTPRGRLFSLLHEFAHLILGTSALCDMTADGIAQTESAVEIRCNAIAAAALMPAERVLQHPAILNHNDRQTWTYERLAPIAATFGVSAEALLRRLATMGVATEREYSIRRDEFLSVYSAEEKSTKTGKGNWYRNKVRDLGKGYVRSVVDSRDRGVVDSFSAASYLDSKVGQISTLGKMANARGDH